MNAADHWENVYAARAEDALTWFEDSPVRSLAALTPVLSPGDPVIDIGGGSSRLAVHLLARGLGPVSVLDISDRALDLARARLGNRASEVTWIVADITRWSPDRSYSAWHDRAVFHFLTEPAGRAAYFGALLNATVSGATVVIHTFDEDGPETCSGLPVRRYSPRELVAEFDRLAPGQFRTVDSHRFKHMTPRGNIQKFQQSVFRRVAS